MRSRLKTVVLALIILVSLTSFACVKKEEKPKAKPTQVIDQELKKAVRSHFGFMPAFFDFKEAERQGGRAREAGGNWNRPYFELWAWGTIEKEPGQFNFSKTDEYVKISQKNGFQTLANIQPFASWDQQKAGKGLTKIETMDPLLGDTRAKPADMEAYKKFVRKLVERYDGDGKDDMGGLRYPVKYWEVANEPEMNKPPLVFFQGIPEDYAEILKATYESVKKADKDAQVVQGGMAGMESWMVDFWQKVFDAGGAKYFDIANIHSIDHGEHLNVLKFKEFLSKNKIDKPFWITEVQIESRMTKEKKTKQGYAESLARSYLFALANGAKKLFYVNLVIPKNFPTGEEGPGFSDLSALISEGGAKNPIFYAHKNIASKLDSFTEVEIISQKLVGRELTEGQYKFTVDGKTIYALWGQGALPTEIKGQLKVTDVLGKTKTADAPKITLTPSPIFIEVK